MKKLLFPFFLFLLLFVTDDARGQNKLKVAVNVSIKEGGTLESIILSYAKREFRSLGDVELVDDPMESEFELAITGYELPDLYVYSTAWLYRPRGLKDEPLDIILRALGIQYAHGLYTCGLDGLKQSIEETVAKFDAEFLERFRGIQ